jgi:hypothetical protein
MDTDRGRLGAPSSPATDLARTESRVATLAGRSVVLPGPGPRVGERLAARFAIPPARRASTPLTADVFHRSVEAAGYSLAGADDESRRAFARAFGVEVLGERRIAHGLFGLWEGEFVAVDIPGDQMLTPGVIHFLDRLHALLHGAGR